MATLVERLILRRPVFVGRHTELREIRAALDAARNGERSLVLVEGEAGVGKTQLVREAERLAAQSGMAVCEATFVEDGAVPYYSLVSALASSLDAAGLMTDEELGTHAEVLRHLGGMSASPASPNKDALGDRARLHGALKRATAVLAARTPLLFAIEDIHWAQPEERAAIQQLILGFEASGSAPGQGVCFVVSVRPPGNDWPLEASLGRLRRESWTRDLHLGGMSELDLGELVQAAVGHSCSPALLNALSQATWGNPLFTLEILRKTIEDGSLINEDGGVTTLTDVASVPLPAELTGAVRERLRSLPRPLRDLLAMAALLDDEITAEALSLVSAQPEMDVLRELDEAVSLGLLAEREQGFQFAHPLLRAGFRETLSAAHRRRLHAQMAGRLATLEPESFHDILRVAHHFVAARSEADAGARRLWSLRAASVATQNYAWGESARYYEVALSAEPTTDLAERAKLLMRAAVAHYHANDLHLSGRRYDQALEAFQELGDADGWALALEGWMSLEIVSRGPAALPGCKARREAFLRRAAAKTTAAARVGVEIQYAGALYARGDVRALRVAESALRAASKLDDPLLLMRAQFGVGAVGILALRPNRAVQVLQEARPIAVRFGDPWDRNKPLLNLPCAQYMAGDLRGARLTAEEARATFSAAQEIGREAYAFAVLAWLALATGEFAAVEDLVAEGRQRALRAEWAGVMEDLLLPLALGRIAVGRAIDAEDTVSLFPPAAPTAQALVRLVGAHRASAAPRPSAAGVALSMPALTQSALEMEELWQSGFQPGHSRGPEPFEAAARRGVVMAPAMGASVARLRGMSAASRGELPRALRRLQRAIDIAGEAGAALDQARSELAMAEVLGLESPARAMALSSRAARRFAEMGAAGYLERCEDLEASLGRPGKRSLPVVHAPGLSDPQIDVLIDMSLSRSVAETAARLTLTDEAVERYRRELAVLGIHSPATARDHLRGMGLASAPEAVVPPRIVTSLRELQAGHLRIIMFTDIVGSTPTNVALGDKLFAELITMQNAIIQAEVGRTGGRVIKGIGDAVMATFESCDSALDCTTAFQERFPLEHPNAPGAAISIRVGLHAGEPIDAGDDILGLAVTLAERVCRHARGGEVVVSDPVRQLATHGLFRFLSRGRAPLKGVEERVRLFVVQRAAAEHHIVR